MADIYQDFFINAPASRVYEAVSTARGLDLWWTKHASGQPKVGAEYTLGFGPNYDWRAEVTQAVPGEAFELRMVEAEPDWLHTRVGFRLDPRAVGTAVRFHHTGWPQANEHWRISCHCWALYLRILRRNLEFGEVVPYEVRLEA